MNGGSGGCGIIGGLGGWSRTPQSSQSLPTPQLRKLYATRHSEPGPPSSHSPSLA